MRPPEAERLSTAVAKQICAQLTRRFIQREDGTITVFATIVFVLMVGVGGISIDLMRYETQRAQMQHTLDRAVLAAASLSQTRDPELVVRNYFETAGLGNYRLKVQVEEDANFRRVAAQAEMEVPTIFMNLFGQRVLTSPASGIAEERLTNIEVSLVLDISGSMGDMNRMTNLRPAARDFITTILGPNTNPTGRQFVSVSIVPYDHTTNMGPTLASVFNLTDEHQYSQCARFYDADFLVPGIDPAAPLQRKGHFDRENSTTDPVSRPSCRRGTSGEILPWSNDEARLHASINALSPFGFTAIDHGMKWAVALLDPSTRPALSQLVAQNVVSDDFEGRPAAHSDPNTRKIIVLMTDGENTRQIDLQPGMRSGPSPFWRDPDDGHFSVYYEEWNQFWQENNRRWSVNPDGGPEQNAVQLDYSDLWEHISVQQLYTRMFHRNSWEQHEGQPSSVELWRRPTIEAMLARFCWACIVDMYVTDAGIGGDDRLRDICNVAHANEIIVFSVAFEAPARGEDLMRHCASSDAHYYDVVGPELSTAFASIARTINQLRLTQ